METELNSSSSIGRANADLINEKRKSNSIRKLLFFSGMFINSLGNGTKLIFIGLSKLNEEWVFFFENITILIGSCICYAILRLGIQRYSEERKKLFADKRLFIGTFVSGISNAAGNLTIIFADHYGLESGGSPAAIMGVIYINTIGVIVVGLFMFKEKHTKLEYAGIIVLIFGLLIITLHVEIEHVSTDFNKNYYYTSILFALITALFWGGTAISSKFVAFYNNNVMTEFSIVTSIMLGLSGSLIFIPNLILKIPLLPESNTGSSDLYILYAGCAGALMVIIMISYHGSLANGSVGLVSLFVNSSILFQALEEFIIFNIVPSLLSGIGIIVVLIGASMIVLFEHKEVNYKHELIREEIKEN